MLNIYRRHTRECPHDSCEEQKCRCPIWIDWHTTTRGGKRTRIRKSLGIYDWQAAKLKTRDMEADGVDAYLAGEHDVLTVQKATDEFEADAKNNIQASTLKQYKIILSRLNAFCKQRGIVFLKQV